MFLYQKFIKKLLDTMLALLLFALFLPLLIVLFCIGSVVFHGHPLFVQKRIGLNNEPFLMFKFRSMHEIAPNVSNSSISVVQQYIPVYGKFIRRNSLDELPQLINIIKGEMSFVGPRPLTKVDEETLYYRSQLNMKNCRPGLTGLAQTNGRNLLTPEQKAQLDVDYARDISFTGDFVIWLRTIYVVLKREGINGKES